MPLDMISVPTRMRTYRTQGRRRKARKGKALVATVRDMSPASRPARTLTAPAAPATDRRYVDGPVSVSGSDPYGLDNDGDGLGCESTGRW